MHPVKFLSCSRGGGLWWPAGLLLNRVIGRTDFFECDVFSGSYDAGYAGSQQR